MAGPIVVSMGAVIVRVSLREVSTVALLLGSCRLGFMLSADIPGLLVGRPVT